MNKIDETLALHQHHTQKCNIKNRTIFCRDNLEIMRGINSECIDLIYLDPPFNKNKKFTAPIGTGAEGASFKDTFHKEDIKDEWFGIISEQNPALSRYIDGITDTGYRYNRYYLVYMAIRLIEMHRILKSTGVLYLHCDRTMAHYLKILLDSIFGEKNFRNEIIWCYHGPSAPKQKIFSQKHDNIFCYTKSDNWTFNRDAVRVKYSGGKPHTGGYGLDKAVADECGQKGKIPEDWWVHRIAPRSKTEYVGYPTQKPIFLLERIINATSNKEDMVLDPFCGCATTCVAAEKLGRHWIGIDISQKAHQLVQERLKNEVWGHPDALYQYKKIPTIIPRTDIPHKTNNTSHN